MLAERMRVVYQAAIGADIAKIADSIVPLRVLSTVLRPRHTSSPRRIERVLSP
jgi:hypothetical protein